MRSYRWRSQATRAAAPDAPGAALRDSAIRIAPPAARVAFSSAALLGSVCLGALAVLAPSTARAVDGTWTAPPPNPKEWTQGTNWSSSPTVPDNIATFTNNGAATSVTISNSTSINTIEFSAAAPAYSFTVQNGATFTINSGTSNNSSFAPGFTVNAGAALTIGDGGFAEIGSLAGGGTVTIGPSSSSSQLSIVGPSSTTFSGTLAGAGTLELDNGTLTLTGPGEQYRRSQYLQLRHQRSHHQRRVSQRHRSRPWHGGRRGNSLGHQWRYAADHQLGCCFLFRDAHQRARVERNREPDRNDRD